MDTERLLKLVSHPPLYFNPFLSLSCSAPEGLGELKSLLRIEMVLELIFRMKTTVCIVHNSKMGQAIV